MKAPLECPRCGATQVQRKKIHVDPAGKAISVRPRAWILLGVGLLIFLYTGINALVLPGERALLTPAELYINQPWIGILGGAGLIGAVLLGDVLPVFMLPTRYANVCTWCALHWREDERKVQQTDSV